MHRPWDNQLKHCEASEGLRSKHVGSSIMRQSTHDAFLLVLAGLHAFLRPTLYDSGFLTTSFEIKFAHAAPRRHTQLSAKPPSTEHLSGGEFNRRVTSSASASEMLQVLHCQRRNPSHNLITVGAAWCTMARLQRSITREVVSDPYLDEFIQDTRRILKRSLQQDCSSCARASANIFWASAKLSSRTHFKRHLAKVQEDFNEAGLHCLVYGPTTRCQCHLGLL